MNSTVLGARESRFEFGLCRFPDHFPGGLDNKKSAWNARDLHSIPGLGRSPWRRARQPTPVFLPGESPWTEELGRSQFLGLQNAGHSRATKRRAAQPWELHWMLCGDVSGKGLQTGGYIRIHMTDSLCYTAHHHKDIIKQLCSNTKSEWERQTGNTIYRTG